MPDKVNPIYFAEIDEQEVLKATMQTRVPQGHHISIQISSGVSYAASISKRKAKT